MSLQEKLVLAAWSQVLLSMSLLSVEAQTYREPYFNLVHKEKVTLEEMEMELPIHSDEVAPASFSPTGHIPVTSLPVKNVAYYPSPDDDGTFIRVDMSDEPLMVFSINEPRPASAVMTIPYFNFKVSLLKPGDVRFYLFTKKNPKEGMELFQDKENAQNVTGYWNKGAQVKILCHGFLSSSEKPFPQLMKNSYLGLEKDLNIILVDWSKVADRTAVVYFEVAKQTTDVGFEVGRLVKSLLKEGLTTLDQIHFIGHSLGAHVGGAMGYYLISNRIGIPYRITGLDPAGPGFCDGKIGQLQPSDAHFVDVIHTDASEYCSGLLSWIAHHRKGKWGSSVTVGHVSFFPNGGSMQPGCGQGLSDSCSHSRAYYYMEESFNGTEGVPTIFQACPCSDYNEYLSGKCECSNENVVIMGENTPVTKKHGKYFLRTGHQYPYSSVI